MVSNKEEFSWIAWNVKENSTDNCSCHKKVLVCVVRRHKTVERDFSILEEQLLFFLCSQHIYSFYWYHTIAASDQSYGWTYDSYHIFLFLS